MSDEVVTTSFGKFLIDPRDIIGSTLKAGTLWDGPGFLMPIAREYGRLGEAGTTILDLGANLGAFSVWLASQGAWRVIAVEPIPETFSRLVANLDLNKETCGPCVIPLNVAAWDERDEVQLAAPLDPGNPGGAAVVKGSGGNALPARPIDAYHYLFKGGVSLIKLDVQGCELRALQGLNQTIYAFRPTIVFEWEDELAAVHNDTLRDMLNLLESIHRYDVRPWPNRAHDFLAVPR